MKLAIACTAFRRPDYLKETLNSLSKNANLENYTLFVACEPGYPDVVKVAQSVDFMKKSVIVNPRVLGVRDNPFMMLKRVFGMGFDACLYWEDDLVASPDMTRLFEWYLNILNVDNYLCLNPFNPDSDESKPDMVVKKKDTSALGIGMTANQWKRWYEPVWYKDNRGWDWSISMMLKEIGDLFSIQPQLSRSHHIGRFQGVHYRPEMHDSQYLHNKWYQGTEKFDFKLAD